MPNTVDRRVVEMRFDNKDFSNNVQDTMTVLDKLKEKLSFKNSGNDFKNSGFADSIEDAKSRFSALEVIGTTALVNLTNSAVNFGKRMATAFTVDQVKAGFSEYELKMGSIQTIMASTGADIQTVNRYLNELNTYSDKTIYSFSDMTNNIGKFTNAGVELDVAVKAIQGISNEAAVSGANAQEASRAMYNFSQALSAGYVKLIDWKSIENANMATKEFKEQLIETAVAEGTLEKAADGTYKVLTTGAGGGFKDTITATKNFNDSLSAAWMTSDVLTKTLAKYSDETTDIGKKAFAAAQDVKTFSQLIDTIKEAIGSGWAQTFELIFGNLEEAKRLWTAVNNVVSDFIGRSSDARNSILQTWHDSSRGRDALLGGFKNLYNAVLSVATPIKEAFRDVFPPATAEMLINFTTGFVKLTHSMIISDSAARKLNAVFTVIFKVLKGGISILSGVFKVFWSFAKILVSIGSVVLDILANIIWKINAMTMGKALDPGADKKTGVLGWLSSLAAICDVVSGKISELTNGGLSKLGAVLGKVGGAIAKVFSFIGKALSSIDLSAIGGILAGGGIMAAGMKISKFVGSISEKLEEMFGKDGEGGGGFMDKVQDTLGTLSDTLNNFQTSVKVGQLVAIAISIGILAASCSTLADIPASKLAASVAAIGGLFVELAGSTHLMKSANTKGIVAMAIAVAILASAVKKLSEVESLGKGLLGVGALLGELTAFCIVFDKMKLKPKALAKTGAGLILMAFAINLLVKPVQAFGSMDTGALVKGLAAMAVMLGEFALTALAFSKIKTGGMIKAGVAMMLMATAMRIMSVPLMDLGSMDIKSLVKGLGAMAVALLEIAGFTAVMGLIASSTGNILKSAAAMVVMSVGIKIMAGALAVMGSMEGAGKGLGVLFGSLTILAVAMIAMQNALPGAVAMIVVAGAIAIITPAIAVLSSLDLKGVGVGLLALAGTLAIFGVGALLLTPVLPLMIALGAAMALLGAGTLALAAGMTLLSVAFSMGTNVIITGATALAEAIPIVAKGFGDAILVILQTLVDGAPLIKDAFIAILDLIIAAGTEVIPKIVTFGLDLIMALLEGIRSRIGDITIAAVEIVTNFLDALGSKAEDLANAGLQFVLDFINGVSNAIAENGTLVINAVWGLILSVIEAVAGAIPVFGDKAAEAIEEYRQNLETGGEKAAGSAKKTANDVGKNLKIDSSATKETKKTMDAFSKTVEDSGKSVSQKASSMATEAGNAMKIPDQTSNGSNAVLGVVNGMDSQIRSLRSKANEVASLVDKVIREKNKIKSPSRVLAKTGKFMMMGLIGGIDSLIPEYQNKAENIATTLISSTNKATDAMNSFTTPNLSATISRTSDVNLRMADLKKENDRLANGISKLTSTLSGMTDTMNSRALNNYINIDGSTDPEAFADGLIRSFRLNARTT